jgi:antitoxin component YwqK of YwqJK toxin-antitoxin module
MKPGSYMEPERLYFPNGQKSTEETWKFNLLTGPVKNYYEDGKLLSNVSTGQPTARACTPAIIQWKD